jgi:translation initiation factor 2B subunit (eIF-2B alpha/beta/delta family)
MAIKGNKFSLGMDVNFLKFNVNSEAYKTFIANLFYWILQDDIFVNLMKFDSYSLFNILTNFLNDPVISKIIKNFDFNKINPLFLQKIGEETDKAFLTKNSTEIRNAEDNQKTTIIKNRNGKDIDYNNPNSVINNIILNLVEKNKVFFTEIDLSLFLIKYASKCTELNPVAGTCKKYIVQGIKKCLTFYEDYLKLKNSSSPEAIDVFKCHKLDKVILENNKIDKNNLFYKEIYKSLRDLLDSEYQWKKDELDDIISSCEKSPFTLAKIKIYELSKKYSDCLDNYLNMENDEILDEDVFTWLQKTFQAFSRKNKNLSEDDFKNLQNAVIDNVEKLSKKSVPKTNKIIKQFYGSKEKITIIHKLDSLPSLQYEFIRQLICPSKGGNLEEITQDKNDLEELNNENDEENDNIQNELCDLFLLQIDLLIVLKKKDEVLPSIKEQIKAYPKIYPKQKCLEKCLEYKINDAAVYLYQSTGKNDEALALTKNNTEKAFEAYLQDGQEESYNYFIQQINLCIKICQDTSEALAKEKNKNNDITNKGGDKLWFDLLKSLYDFVKRCESENKKEIEKKISENIEYLLKKMCLHVSLQNIIETVTEIQKDAQYKEFKNILEDMLRSNNSFNRILKNTKLILQSSIVKTEIERNQRSIRGNCYNNRFCDVCRKNFIKSKSEVLACFGCGHQSHRRCAHCNTNNYDECVICRREGIGNDDMDKILENRDNSIIKNDNNNAITTKDSNSLDKKGKDLFIFGNRNDKIKKLKDYDRKYIENLTEIF